MADNKVTFKKGTSAQYQACEKDPDTVYWLTDTKELYVGTTLYGTGAEASKQIPGLMSTKDKTTLDSIPKVYNTVKFELIKNDLPEGYRTSIKDGEFRVMFPENATWTDQHGGGEPNKFYMGLKIFAPNNDIDGFKRGEGKEIEEDKEYVKCTSGGDTGGIDEYGRKYYVVWLPVANKVEEEWHYYGATSEEGHFIGWYITIAWYDKNPDEGGHIISSETVRINLTNEKCHNSTLPYYTSQMSMSWGKIKEE